MITLVATVTLSANPPQIPGKTRSAAQLFASQGGIVQQSTGNKTLLVACTEDSVLECIAKRDRHYALCSQCAVE